MRETKDLHPKLQSLICDLKSACEQQGLKIGISECLRTKEEQDRLYAKGRTEKGSIVTNAKGSSYSSMHQWGIAFDFYRADGNGAYNNTDGFFEKVGKIGKTLGLEWGGDFKSIKDLPHFQLSDWGSTPKKLKTDYKTPEDFFKTWEENAMTEAEKQKFNLLVEQVEKLTLAQEKVYHFTAELPAWARNIIQKLIDKGIYAGNSESDLNLPETLMRILVINDRAGLYD
ncbi:MAG: M15 family metallopeptidase [Clostridia bacterium]|nr:M15 family metallopeptidase [Clostridia bacterium]